MKARIEYKWGTAEHQVWLYEQDARGGRVLRFGDQGWFDWEDVPNGGPFPDPTLTLPSEALAAIVAEGSDVLPPSGQVAEHLKDARGTRDRLLSMLEKRGIR